ncbi:MAG: peptide chain release factor N(5)-glutamine methyltransferase [Pseudomonadota bacterium]
MNPAQTEAAKRLKSAGLENANQEARWLSDHAKDNNLSLNKLVTRRCTGEPLQHIIGTTPFHAITLKTDARALIPRSDSESVVNLALDLLRSDIDLKIADLGAGTGALLLAILHQRKTARGIAIERSNPAVGLLSENIELLELTDRTDVFQGSWADWRGWTDCDLIVSNPPYIQSNIIPTLSAEVRDYDPIEALDGGADGLSAYREIIDLGTRQMTSGSWLVLEIGYDQKNSVTTILKQNGFSNIAHRTDLSGNDRAIAAQKP